MTAEERLITAMHTAGGVSAYAVSEWIALAQEHAPLRDAFAKTFGKRLPTPQKLGLWLSERLGKMVGPLKLAGRHSGKRKAWVYAVVNFEKLEAKRREEAEREAAMAVQLEEQRRLQAIALEAAQKVQAAERAEAERVAEQLRMRNTHGLLAAHSPDRIPVGVDRDGTPKFENVPPVPRGGYSLLDGCKLIETKRAYREGRYWFVEIWMRPDGRSFENWREPGDGVANGKEWQPAGIKGRPTRKQLAARHHQTEQPADIHRPTSPGLPLPGLSGPSGVRVDSSGAESWTNRLNLKDF